MFSKITSLFTARKNTQPSAKDRSAAAAQAAVMRPHDAVIDFVALETHHAPEVRSQAAQLRHAQILGRAYAHLAQGLLPIMHTALKAFKPSAALRAALRREILTQTQNRRYFWAYATSEDVVEITAKRLSSGAKAVIVTDDPNAVDLLRRKINERPEHHWSANLSNMIGVYWLTPHSYPQFLTAPAFAIPT
jgi:hypothetical protein